MRACGRNSSLYVFAAILVLLVLGLSAQSHAQVILDQEQIDAIKRHGPWPPVFEEDPSNRVSGSAPAVELGRKLFIDPSLSRDGDVACVTCHLPSTSIKGVKSSESPPSRYQGGLPTAVQSVPS